MIELVFVLVVMFAYLGVGARYSRNRYAEITHRNNNPDYSSMEFAKDELKRLESISPIRNKKMHRHDCRQQNYDYVTACDCGATSNLEKKKAELRKITGDVLPDRPSVIAPMLWWPGYKLTSYLTSGTVPETPEQAIARMERELLEIK